MAPDSKIIVIDASVVLKWQFDDEECVEQALMLRHDFFIKGAIHAIAPHLLLYELANGIVVAARKKRVAIGKCNDIMRNLLSLNIEFRSAEPLLILELAVKHNITAYDAAYFSLAKSENCELWTGDKAFHHSVSDKQVKWIGDYAS